MGKIRKYIKNSEINNLQTSEDRIKNVKPETAKTYINNFTIL